MSRLNKIMTTLWTCLLVAPLLWAFGAYALLECGELDPCPNGGPMPYAPVAIALFTVTLVAQIAFLVMVWRSGRRV